LIECTVLGLIAGLIASKLANKRRDGLFLDILLGGVGAVLCGWLFNAARVGGLTQFNAWGLAFAVVGAIFVVVLRSFRKPASKG